MLPVWKQIFSISIWVHGRPLTLSRRGKCLQSTFPSTLRGVSGAMCPDDAVLATTVLFAQSCGKREGGFHDFGNTKGKHCWKNNTSVQQTRRCTAAHWKPFKYMMATKRRVTALQSAAWEGGYFYYDFLWYWHFWTAWNREKCLGMAGKQRQVAFLLVLPQTANHLELKMFLSNTAAITSQS